jgi:hypothetical protein
MTKFAGADAMRNLLHFADLRLVPRTTEDWLAVADEIRQGRCNVQRLVLVMLRVERSEATEAVKAVISAIRLDHNLEHLSLETMNDFTDEMGVALA